MSVPSLPGHEHVSEIIRTVAYFVPNEVIFQIKHADSSHVRVVPTFFDIYFGCKHFTIMIHDVKI